MSAKERLDRQFRTEAEPEPRRRAAARPAIPPPFRCGSHKPIFRCGWQSCGFRAHEAQFTGGR